MQERNEILKYEGVLTFSDISELLNQLKDQMDSMGEKLVTYKRLIILMVEVLENIKKYIDASVEDQQAVKEHLTYFDLSKSDETTFHLTARNIIRNEHISGIQEKVNLVNGMDTAGLRAYYRQVIANGQFSMEGGAGLGFIELAKTSENKIDVGFEKINDKYSNYTIKLLINT